jgi:C1A family cysteine protease
MLIGLAALMATSFFLLTSQSSSEDLSANQAVMNTWEEWKSKHSKVYTSEEEESYRFKAFLGNLKYISENQGETYTLGLNIFSDLTNEEFRSAYLMPKGTIKSHHTEETAFQIPEGFQAPTSVDWVSQGKTVTVLNQGQCGSCWAFSTVESIDSAYAVTQNIAPPNLSEQQVVSCSLLYGELGCNGGNVVPAYKYVLANPLTTNDQYPYTSGNTQKTGLCNPSLAKQGTYKITGYKTVPSGDCNTL